VNKTYPPTCGGFPHPVPLPEGEGESSNSKITTIKTLAKNS